MIRIVNEFNTDKYKRMITERLNKCIYETDIIAKIEGDEFTILLSRIDDVEYLIYIAENRMFNSKESFILS